VEKGGGRERLKTSGVGAWTAGEISTSPAEGKKERTSGDAVCRDESGSSWGNKGRERAWKPSPRIDCSGLQSDLALETVEKVGKKKSKIAKKGSHTSITGSLKNWRKGGTSEIKVKSQRTVERNPKGEKKTKI